MSKSVLDRKYCKQPVHIERTLEAGISQNRMSYIRTVELKWVNGTVIKYMFIEGEEPQKNVVRDAFKSWKDLDIGISFLEVNSVDDSMVRIGFNHNDGSWSYVGRDILTIPKNQRTMNFGWDLTEDSYGMTTAIHEIGHTIGFQHEHQSPFSGIVWDTNAVYIEFSGPPNNWEKSAIDSNIINKLPPNLVEGSVWDPSSIMEYQFGPGLVLQPVEYKEGIYPPGTLSQKDINGVKSFYPVVQESSEIQIYPLKSVPITAKSGEQVDFIFKAPSTKKYTFQTIGEFDTVMVVYEKTIKENHFLAGDDDSGFDKNAKIKLPLIKGREYLINIRVMYSSGEDSGAIIVS